MPSDGSRVAIGANVTRFRCRCTDDKCTNFADDDSTLCDECRLSSRDRFDESTVVIGALILLTAGAVRVRGQRTI
jgi:hypothetical protein